MNGEIAKRQRLTVIGPTEEIIRMRFTVITSTMDSLDVEYCAQIGPIHISHLSLTHRLVVYNHFSQSNSAPAQPVSRKKNGKLLLILRT